jgi:predicted DNA-binding transcriptional regulator AlpA
MPRKQKSRNEIKVQRGITLLKRFAEIGEVPKINDDFFYRLQVLPFFLGLEKSQIFEAIGANKFPPPVSLTDNGRARGYFGHQLKAIQAKAKEVA